MHRQAKFVIWLSVFLSLSLVSVASLARADSEETTVVEAAATHSTLPAYEGPPLSLVLDQAIYVHHSTVAAIEAQRVIEERAAAEQAAREAAERERARREAAARAQASAPAERSTYNGACSSGDPDNLACWDRLAQCESGGNWAINTGNGYYGGIQFSLSSWRGVGGTGYPHEHSRETQIEMGRRLYASGGWSHWPGCTRSFGWPQ